MSRALATEQGELDEARRVALAVLQAVAGRVTAAVRLGAAQRLIESAKKKSGAAERDLLGRRLEAMASLLRDVGGVQAGAPPRALASPDLVQSLAAIGGQLDGPRLSRAFERVGEARRALERNQSPKVVADWLACEL